MALRPCVLRPNAFLSRREPIVIVLSSASRAMRHQSTSLAHTLQTRTIAPIFDDLSPDRSFRLSTLLADYLPSHFPSPLSLPPLPSAALPLPPAHHTLYFEPSKRNHLLLPDGTNPDHWPGEPFTRRMWAGARVRYGPASTLPQQLRLDGRRAVCAEFIRDARALGGGGGGGGSSSSTKSDDPATNLPEKILVSIERRMALASPEEEKLCAQLTTPSTPTAPTHEDDTRRTLDHLVRQRLWRADEDDLGPCGLVETRSLVFLRPRTAAQGERDAQRAKANAQSASASSSASRTWRADPDWTHTLVPDPGLLFRFSALTFNAHAIHLDPRFAREVEGYRERLVHGPLTYTLMVTLLGGFLRTGERVRRVEYRNSAPLYCSEPVTFCGKRVAEGKWEVWALGPEGDLAVRGTVVTESHGG